MATATTTQTTHAPTIGRSSGGGGGGPSGSGGGFGSGPPGGAGGPPGGGGGGGPPGGGAGPGPGQAVGGAKLMGNPPQIFDGERERTQLFLSQWEIYWGLNYQVDAMAQPYSWVLCFLSYIQGPEVQDWVTHELQWLREQVHGNHVLPNNPWLWAQMMVHFGNAFVDMMTQAKARNELTKLRMEGGHIDEYIAKFERYVTMAGYGVDEPTVLEKFIKGLPTPLARNCVKMDNPDSWDEWKESTRKRQEVYIRWRQILGVADTKKEQSSSKKKDLNQWRQGFGSKRTERDPNAMDTSPGRTRAQRMTTEERARLMNEGKCFNCQRKGHFSRDCPQSPSPPDRDRTPRARKGKAKKVESDDENSLSETEEIPPAPKIKASKRKLTGEELMALVKDADDDAKDYVIQNAFMKEDF